jgi:SAM-dependent methyltransferase
MSKGMTGFDERWETDVYGRGQQVNKYPFDSVVSSVFRRFGRVEDRSRVRVLELGCGTANNILFLCEEGFDAVGVDGSSSAIEIGRRLLQEKGQQAELLCQDFTDLSNFSDESFDLVIDRGSMTHNRRADIHRTVGEVDRVLKTGGIFLSHIFSDRHCGRKFGKALGDGSYHSFEGGAFDGLDFLFFFASPADIREIFKLRFKLLSVMHNDSDETLNEDDIHAMWHVTAQKVPASLRQ